MLRKAIERKQQEVDALAEKMAASNSFVILDYLGLSVEAVTKLRVELFNNGCDMKVIKNNIIRRAVEKAGYSEIVEHLTGPNAIAFSHEDSVSAAKVIYEFAKDYKDLSLKVGVVDGQYMDHDGITTIATIPSRDALLTMFAGGVIQHAKDFAIALQLHIENLEEAQDAQ